MPFASSPGNMYPSVSKQIMNGLEISVAVFSMPGTAGLRKKWKREVSASRISEWGLDQQRPCGTPQSGSWVCSKLQSWAETPGRRQCVLKIPPDMSPAAVTLTPSNPGPRGPHIASRLAFVWADLWAIVPMSLCSLLPSGHYVCQDGVVTVLFPQWP